MSVMLNRTKQLEGASAFMLEDEQVREQSGYLIRTWLSTGLTPVTFRVKMWANATPLI